MMSMSINSWKGGSHVGELLMNVSRTNYAMSNNGQANVEDCSVSCEPG